ncbi:MAG: DUF401 family protein [Desulfatiglandaceae bacterium]
MEIEATVKILIVFAGILIAARFRMSLGVALFAGGIVLDFWSGRGDLVWSDLGKAVLQPDLWLFLINISLIIEFGVFMTESENSKALISVVHRIAGRHGRIFSLVLLPAALGLVPMPGGAMFSAPLVKKTVDGKDLSPEWKSAANYWFRHIMEYWWPIYPVVIVTLSILPIPAWKFVLLQMPFTVASVVAGAVFIIYPHRNKLDLKSDELEKRSGGFYVLLPLIIVAVSIMVLPEILGILFPGLDSGTAKLLGMFIGLCSGLGLISKYRKGREKGHVIKQFFTKKNTGILVTLIGVMVFKSLLESSGIITLAGEELSARDLPLIFVVGALPFLAGLVTGIAIGFAGTTFPLIVGLLSAPSVDISIVAALPIAFSMGYAGMMLSPLHLCLLLTKDYFEANLLKVYIYLIPCTLVIVFTGIGMHLLLSAFGW